MKAVSIGKTIIVWDNLVDKEAKELIEIIEKMIYIYRNYKKDINFSKVIPIQLVKNNEFISILKKGNEILVSMSKNNGNYSYNPIINGDELYKSIHILKNCEQLIINRINMAQRFPQTKWIELPFNKAFESYCLSPNINPESFIKNLETGTLSESSKKFLKEVGFSLENSSFSKELRNTIDEANELFIER